jgi:hypothetical protein
MTKIGIKGNESVKMAVLQWEVTILGFARIPISAAFG